MGGQNKLCFIDTRFDAKTAAHIKEQIERAGIPKPEEYVFIDEILATAEIRVAKTNETTFVFDPVFARVFFAPGMNRHNPELKLPLFEGTSKTSMLYDLDALMEKQKALCSDLESQARANETADSK